MRPSVAREAMAAATALSLLLVCLFPAVGSAGTISSATLENYIASSARSWEQYATPDGQMIDPLVPSAIQDNYGSVMLADVMLQSSARSGDPQLAQTGERIIESSLQLPNTNGPFNLLAIAMLIRDGQAGYFPAGVWPRISEQVEAFAAHILPQAKTGDCLPTPGCYNNWLLVWTAGVAGLLAAHVPELEGATAALDSEGQTYLSMAVAHAGSPTRPSPLGTTQELSDRGAEPLAYALFSSIQLELIASGVPALITPEVEHLRESAARYALELMAPDGQLSFAGRSLDQSWVQTAAADLGARQALVDPRDAAQWRSFAEQAVSYLIGTYTPLPSGIIPTVPGLLSEWNQAIMDPYAAENCYAGMTLWFLNDALHHWPGATEARAPLPANAPDPLVGDLHSSGLVWGRSGDVWWAVSGHTTCGGDPRCAEGVVDVKLETETGWHDLLALRPIQRGRSGAWVLHFPHGYEVVPQFVVARGSGHKATLSGTYRRPGGKIGLITWSLTTGPAGLTSELDVPRGAVLSTDVWLSPGHGLVAAKGASAEHEPCYVTASGPACPVELSWPRGGRASMEVLG